MSVIHADYSPAGLVDFPVYGITVTIIKSAVEAMDPLLVPPSIPVSPILTICGSFQSSLDIVLLLPIWRAVRKDNGLTLFVHYCWIVKLKT